MKVVSHEYFRVGTQKQKTGGRALSRWSGALESGENSHSARPQESPLAQAEQIRSSTTPKCALLVLFFSCDLTCLAQVATPLHQSRKNAKVTSTKKYHRVSVKSYVNEQIQLTPMFDPRKLRKMCPETITNKKRKEGLGKGATICICSERLRKNHPKCPIAIYIHIYIYTYIYIYIYSLLSLLRTLRVLGCHC